MSQIGVDTLNAQLQVVAKQIANETATLESLQLETTKAERTLASLQVEEAQLTADIQTLTPTRKAVRA